MFSKINMKWLAGIFVILLLLAVLITLRNTGNSARSKNRNFKSELVQLDTSKVNFITIDPKFSEQPIELKKTDEGWKLVSEDKSYNADESAIKNMLSTLNSMRAKRMAANQKDQWKKYEVTDSLATRIRIYSDKKELLNILLGKFSYQQPKNPNPYNYQQQGTMTSYVRLEGDKEVYAVDGMVAMSFNRQPQDFRNHQLLRAGTDTWNRIELKSPDDNYVLTKKGNNWMIEGIQADSAATASYLSALRYLSSSNFIDESLALSKQPAWELSIEGENMPQAVRIDAFPSDTTNNWAIVSNRNKGSYFSGKEGGLFQKVFKPREYFLGSLKEGE